MKKIVIDNVVDPDFIQKVWMWVVIVCAILGFPAAILLKRGV